MQIKIIAGNEKTNEKANFYSELRFAYVEAPL